MLLLGNNPVHLSEQPISIYAATIRKERNLVEGCFATIGYKVKNKYLILPKIFFPGKSGKEKAPFYGAVRVWDIPPL